MSTSQFSLLRQRRFAPFFATQLAGAFNDSFFKQLLILLVTFHAAEYSTLAAGLVTSIAAGLFILPFVLFSAIAGQLADRYDKALVIRRVKMVEVGIMLVASIGFYFKSLPVLLGHTLDQVFERVGGHARTPGATSPGGCAVAGEKPADDAIAATPDCMTARGGCRQEQDMGAASPWQRVISRDHAVLTHARPCWMQAPTGRRPSQFDGSGVTGSGVLKMN